MDIQKLVMTPSESLTVELKNWISPDTDDGLAKMVKAAIAMRNNNGGYILIGFDNKTCRPIHKNAPKNISAKPWGQVFILHFMPKSVKIENLPPLASLT